MSTRFGNLNTVFTLLIVSAAALTSMSQASEPRGGVYKFGATWCGPCQQVAPVVDRLKREGLPIHSVDIDEQKDLANRFRIQRVPTFVLVVDGKEVDRVTGLMTEGEIRAMAARVPATPVDPAPVIANTSQPQPAAGVNSDTSLGPAAPLPRPIDHPVHEETIAPPAAPEPSGFAGLFGRGNNSAPSTPDVRGTDSQLGEPAAPAVDAPFAILNVGNAPMDASIRIRVKNGDNMNLGSGTVISSRPGYTIIATCAHIFRNYTATGKIEVDVFQNGQTTLYLATLEKFNEKADVGLISIPTDTPIPAVKVGSPNAAPEEGEAVACVGCSGGETPTREQLRVTNINRYEGPHNIECTGVPVQGRSGGGLFNQDGELVGICIAADKDGQRGLYSGLFAVHALLDECNLTALYQPPTPAAPPAAAPAFPTDNQVTPGMLVNHDSNPFANSATQPATSAQPVDVAANGAEVVVIIRDKNQPGGQDRIVIIHEATPTFMKYLNGELGSAPPGPTSFGMSMTQPHTTNRHVAPATQPSVETVPGIQRPRRTTQETPTVRSSDLELTSKNATRFQRTVR
ncbi:MAG: trypsin-like peptidase domain-containing protein [Planctomycetaceae bacterium]|nr:trypsin-like peptidase domain-containing protein [Planctomycetaceae bacterium]